MLKRHTFCLHTQTHCTDTHFMPTICKARNEHTHTCTHTHIHTHVLTHTHTQNAHTHMYAKTRELTFSPPSGSFTRAGQAFLQRGMPARA